MPGGGLRSLVRLDLRNAHDLILYLDKMLVNLLDLSELVALADCVLHEADSLLFDFAQVQPLPRFVKQAVYVRGKALVRRSRLLGARPLFRDRLHDFVGHPRVLSLFS